ncbi:hypothetical protein RvY_17809 [Ramazzottius varieornatus]|uniref:Uncharacterized protein n=1 Tax=Ramazzottius varieornatus TaxID=947166 RepID=A0A1D1WA45_RAMVA|nr:hypothetical protein RvY_17809 [Ramazzottius varieornatus]
MDVDRTRGHTLRLPISFHKRTTQRHSAEPHNLENQPFSFNHRVLEVIHSGIQPADFVGQLTLGDSGALPTIMNRIWPPICAWTFLKMSRSQNVDLVITRLKHRNEKQ